MARAPFWAIVLVLAALLACKKKQSESTPAPAPTVDPTAAKAAELKPKAKARLDQFVALSKKVKSEPDVKADKGFKTKLEKEKFVIIGDKWCEDPQYRHGDSEIDLGSSVLYLCKSALEKTSPASDDLKYWEECLSWTHLAVLRPRKISFPKIKMESKTFEPGEVTGDMLLFDIASGEIKGRYRMRITNSDELTWYEGKPEKEWFDESKRDLVKNVTGVAEEMLQLERDSMGK